MDAMIRYQFLFNFVPRTVVLAVRKGEPHSHSDIQNTPELLERSCPGVPVSRTGISSGRFTPLIPLFVVFYLFIYLFTGRAFLYRKYR